jgi:uncharacterized phiE125 gp8 family phage protein
MSLRLIAAPSQLPVSLEEMKLHLRVDTADDDGLIAGLIRAAVQNLDGRDGWLGRSLVTQTWELVLDCFPAHEIKIPLPPLQSITSLKYDDVNGDEQTLSTSAYTVDNYSRIGWIIPVTGTPWPATFRGVNAVRIRFVSGYPADSSSPPDLSANVPEPIKLAVKRIVTTHYEIRDDVIVDKAAAKMPGGVEALLAPLRVW